MNETTYTPTFTSSASALRTLRAGKRNPNWRYAADYLMERAAPDVKLLVEAATEIEVEKLLPKTPTATKPPAGPWYSNPYVWLIFFATLATTSGLIIYIVENFTLRC